MARVAEQGSEVVEADLLRDQLLGGQVAAGVQGAGHDPVHGEQGEEQGEDADDVPPARVDEPSAEAALGADGPLEAGSAVHLGRRRGLPPRPGLLEPRGPDGGALPEIRHQLTSSKVRVYRNPKAEIPATRMKMIVEIAVARPKSCPVPSKATE